MDMLGDPPLLDLDDPEWRIFSRNPVMPPHYVGQDAQIEDSLITEGCCVNGSVRHSVLFAGVTVEKNAVIIDSVLLPGAVVERGARIFKSIIGENSRIGALATVGGPLRPGETVDNKLTGDIALVGNDISIGAGEYLAAGRVVSHSLNYEEEVKW